MNVFRGMQPPLEVLRLLSYLDQPRIHFGGAFYAGPSTINNRVTHYQPTVPLQNPDGSYLAQTLWNPKGLAQFYLQGCRVTGVVAADGSFISDPAKDALVGAPVTTASPETPPAPGLPASFPKLVDLDPDQQLRSELYGLILSMELPGGGGLRGWFDPPQLRDLWQEFEQLVGSWTSVGAWQTSARPVEGETSLQLGPGLLQWFEPSLPNSPLFAGFREACRHGVSLKLTVDLHRYQPEFQFFQGDVFRFGRVQGTLGPLVPGEFSRWAPARRLIGQDNSPCNPAWFQLREAADGTRRLTCDLGGSLRLATRSGPGAPKDSKGQPFALSEGRPLFSEPLVFGFLRPLHPTQPVLDKVAIHPIRLHGSDEEWEFVPFAQGTLDPTSGLVPTSDEASAVKQCLLWSNAQVFSFPLTQAEFEAVSRTPVALWSRGALALSEPPDGLSGYIDTSSLRLQQGESATATLQLLRWGKPTTADVGLSVFKIGWTKTEEGTWQRSTQPAGDEVTVTTRPGSEPGMLLLEVRTTSQPLAIPEVRSAQDSLVYQVKSSLVLGDSGPGFGLGTQAILTVLLWRAFQAPDTPSWREVGPILQTYARLYPGMRERFDIGDEATVRSNLPAMLAHMGADRLHPMYMPVTRDLSPAKVDMLLRWLRAQSTADQQEQVP